MIQFSAYIKVVREEAHFEFKVKLVVKFHGNSKNIKVFIALK